MPIEIKRNSEINFGPEDLEGRNFRVPTVRWEGNMYGLHGLHLPNDWETSMEKVNDFALQRLCEMHFKNAQDPEVGVDSKLGIITSVKFNKNNGGCVYLDTTMVRSGCYIAKGIGDLSEAVAYQRFLANYLSWASEFKINYPYILDRGRDLSGSADLAIPDVLLKSKEALTSEIYQKHFEKVAWKISGMFGTDIRYLKFDNRGLLDYVQIDRDDCNYSFDGAFRTYNPHNVDNVYQAATLHGIVAEFINDLLEREAQEE